LLGGLGCWVVGVLGWCLLGCWVVVLEFLVYRVVVSSLLLLDPDVCSSTTTRCDDGDKMIGLRGCVCVGGGLSYRIQHPTISPHPQSTHKPTQNPTHNNEPTNQNNKPTNQNNQQVRLLAARTLQWCKPHAHAFFRESCFRQSGDVSRAFNPSHYRHPSFYTKVFSEVRTMRARARTHTHQRTQTHRHRHRHKHTQTHTCKQQPIPNHRWPSFLPFVVIDLWTPTPHPIFINRSIFKTPSPTGPPTLLIILIHQVRCEDSEGRVWGLELVRSRNLETYVEVCVCVCVCVLGGGVGSVCVCVCVWNLETHGRGMYVCMYVFGVCLGCLCWCVCVFWVFGCVSVVCVCGIWKPA
jgi:hypothetical protein